MSHSDLRDEDQEEAPLDPAAQRLQAKLRRLLLGSSLIMFLGFIAVFAAIMYKINASGGNEADRFAETIELAPGSEVQSATLSDGVLVLLVRKENATSIVYVDASTGATLGTSGFVGR
ncbi:conserved hypothetical protein [Roseibium sp. TrichSKD4]|uniref:hypothetical protein n=1 Tax=Roseibium sp. TrichSKD4 TaxID=744980 RepID=UPI0001E56E29|nr:hypothetical protein [Roseibium sp. TrichSKD4]EFO31572.1 conserved hypothetical protein [Roseibium sp. TrichSKD4]